MDTFGLKIIASDGVFYEGRCKKLIIPARMEKREFLQMMRIW